MRSIWQIAEYLPTGDCYTGDGKCYSGKVSTSKTGKTCQRWDTDTPHSHTPGNPGHLDAGNYPDATVADAANYCRNPGGSNEEKPWCYTTDPAQRYDFCDILECDQGGK